MDDLQTWIDEQLADIEAMKDEAKKWQTEIKKEARNWHDSVLRELNGWKYEIEDELEMLREEANGYKGIAGEGAGSEDLLGSSTGKSDKAKANDSSGRKGRSRTSRTK